MTNRDWQGRQTIAWYILITHVNKWLTLLTESLIHVTQCTLCKLHHIVVNISVLKHYSTGIGQRPVCTLIQTRVDYCNSALAGLSDSALASLQRVLHAAARFVPDLQPRDHVTVRIAHCTGYRCVYILHVSCAHWCTVLPLIMLLLVY